MERFENLIVVLSAGEGSQTVFPRPTSLSEALEEVSPVFVRSAAERAEIRRLRAAFARGLMLALRRAVMAQFGRIFSRRRRMGYLTWRRSMWCLAECVCTLNQVA